MQHKPPIGRPERRWVRLREYDYSTPGAYFVTICADGRRCIFGSSEDASIRLTSWGAMARTEWERLGKRWSNVSIDEFVVMPNHIHGLVLIIDNGERAPKLGSIVNAFKGDVVKRVRDVSGNSSMALWQRSYYDHIVRDQDELDRIREYIRNNPAQWAEDEYYR
jgi:REP element-mobilizing transposase RayT